MSKMPMMTSAELVVGAVRGLIDLKLRLDEVEQAYERQRALVFGVLQDVPGQRLELDGFVVVRHEGGITSSFSRAQLLQELRGRGWSEDDIAALVEACTLRRETGAGIRLTRVQAGRVVREEMAG